MILGITGTIGAGKGTVVEFLKQKGFNHYSVRDLLTKEIEKRNIPVNIDSMVLVANDLRDKNSPEYIVKQLYQQAVKQGGNSIIESIRCTGEVEYLKSNGNFYLIAVDAPAFIRYSRVILRSSETDNLAYDEFLEKEKRQMQSMNPSEQNIRRCMEMADFMVRNDKDLEYLKKQVNFIYDRIKLPEPKTEEEIKPVEKIKPLGQPYTETRPVANTTSNAILNMVSNTTPKIISSPPVNKRPSWDEYFLEIMKAVAKRATCDRGRSGCVIAKDKHILVTGYVGSPIGIPHCDEIGHQFKQVIHEDGKISQHCVRTAHAEQNAICQAAKLGIPLNGATLYCTMTPCYVCAKMIINSGIKRVVCEKKYHQGKDSEDLFKQAGIELDIVSDEVESY